MRTPKFLTKILRHGAKPQPTAHATVPLAPAIVRPTSVATEPLEALVARGDLSGLESYAFEGTESIAVDWREQDDAIVGYVAERLDEPLGGAWIDEDESDFELVFRDRRLRAGLTMTAVDRCVMLTAINTIVRRSYEVRAFAASVSTGDTLLCCVRPYEWWLRMDAQYTHQMQQAFCRFRVGIDLFAVASPEEANSATAQSWRVAADRERERVKALGGGQKE